MKKNMQMMLKSASAIALLAHSVPLIVSAQEEQSLEEITVTATKRASSIKDVPFSINAQTANDIRRSGAQSLEDLSRNVAGLMIQNLGPGQSQVAIRGVSAGQVVRDQPGVKEQVGVYLDESVISLSLFTPDLDFYDLNRVETLRGPQGTLFGSGSIGGTLRYITNQPLLNTTEGSMEVDINNMKDGETGGHIKAMANLPLSDKAAVRLVAYHTEYAGYIDAILNKKGARNKDVNDGTRTGLRMAMKFEASEAVSVTPRVIYQKIDMNGFNRQEVFNLYANEYTTPAYEYKEREQFRKLEEKFEDETLIADLLVEAEFDGFDLTSISSYTDRSILVSRDASGLTGSVSIDLGFPAAGVRLPSNLRDTTELEQFTQEIRLSSNDDGPLQWIVGGYYANTDRFYEQYLPTPGYDAVTDATLGAGTSAGAGAGVAPADSPYFSQLPYSLEQFAGFGELTYDMNDKLQLTAGARYYDYSEERTATIVGLFGSGIVDQEDPTTSNGLTTRFMASYDMNEDVTLNAQISKGFRLGGVNDPLNVGLCDASDLDTFGNFQAYDDETMWNYEAGVKVNKGSFSFNAAAYYNKINNLQVTLDAGSCSSRVVFNVEDATTKGIEAEFKAVVSDNLDVTFAGSIVDAKFGSDVYAGGSLIIADEDRLPSVPKVNLGATFYLHFPVDYFGGSELFMTSTLQHRGSVYTQPADQRNGGIATFNHGLAFAGMDGSESTTLDLLLGSYTTINVSVGIATEEWELVGYVKNLTDTNVNLSFDRERGGRARLGYRTNEPATAGITYRRKF
ncbi:TonB-dependent receptor [Temperatibacter marinus]|uniref:TonB-dependent receptor n=1 Tax=Temperatibacter marinus TaxID=1456591 RepID=A0AA52ED36_9PROT|nr:TonB-dependent receptor [Temperatibacter marinus]WND01483.1 TonB-dependent receptor [Temperatibacter marinus]